MTDVVPAAGLDKPCPGCQALALKTLLECASISLQENHYRLDQQQLSAAYLETPPLILSLLLLKATVSTCCTCSLLYTEIAKAVPADAEFVILCRCEERDDRLNNLWIYYGQSKEPVARIYCYADEGQLFP